MIPVEIHTLAVIRPVIGFVEDLALVTGFDNAAVSHGDFRGSVDVLAELWVNL